MGKFKTDWANQKFVIKVLLASNGVMAALLVICFLAFLKASLNRVINIEIPPYTYSPITVGAKSYIEWWGKYLVDIVSEYSPSNYEAKIDLLCTYATSDAGRKFKEEKARLAPEIKRNNIYQSFHPEEGTWTVKQLEGKRWRVEVQGELVRHFGNLTKEQKKYLYWVDIKFKDRVYVEGFGYAPKS